MAALSLLEINEAPQADEIRHPPPEGVSQLGSGPSLIGDSTAWDARLARSPQATLFCSTPFLKALGCRYRLFEVRDGQRVVALLPVTEDDCGERVLPQPFTPYQGLLFLHEAASAKRQRVLDEFRIGECVAAELASRYREVRLPLSWQVLDLRPFLWHKYHDLDASHFQLTPRYTALLDLAGVDEADIPLQARACRRQELRKAAAFELRDDITVDEFLALYRQTFARQDIGLSEATLALVRRITEAALTQGWGRLSGCITPQGLAAATLFTFDHARSYYLFSANDPAQRNSGAATRLMFDNILDAKRRGLAELDFVGVNSPARGDFKLSFNPALKMYFELHHVQASVARPVHSKPDDDAHLRAVTEVGSSASLGASAVLATHAALHLEAAAASV